MFKIFVTVDKHQRF